MFMEERFERSDSCTSDMRQCRPPIQEVTEHLGIAVFEPVQRLRIVKLEGADQAVACTRDTVDQLAPLLDQRSKHAHGWDLRPEWLQAFRMAPQQVQCSMGIGWIIFGATGNKGSAVTRQRCCVNREEN